MDSAELSRLLGVWTDADERLPDALARTISELVDHGFVPAGSTLPPQRKLAQVLGVARGTVASALAMLEAGGYVVSTRGSGTRVRSGRVSAEHRAGGRLFSFTNAPRDVIDLSSGALPASAVTGEVLSASLDGLDPAVEVHKAPKVDTTPPLSNRSYPAHGLGEELGIAGLLPTLPGMEEG